MDSFLTELSLLIEENAFLAPILAFLAGVLTSFTPCVLSSVPLIIGYVGENQTTDTKKALKYSIVFALGMTITFSLLGVLASAFGIVFIKGGNWWFIILGILMILMALQTFEIITFIKPTYLQSKNKAKGYLGAFITGVLGGFFSSPCATPVLVALLAVVASSRNILYGFLLLLLYSLGNSILIIAVGTLSRICHKNK